MITNPEQSGVLAFYGCCCSIGFGLLMGWAGGMVLAKLVRRLNLAEGLYALIVSGGLWVFAFTSTASVAAASWRFIWQGLSSATSIPAQPNTFGDDGRPGVAGAGDFVRRTGFGW